MSRIDLTRDVVSEYAAVIFYLEFDRVFRIKFDILNLAGTIIETGNAREVAYMGHMSITNMIKAILKDHYKISCGLVQDLQYDMTEIKLNTISLPDYLVEFVILNKNKYDVIEICAKVIIDEGANVITRKINNYKLESDNDLLLRIFDNDLAKELAIEVVSDFNSYENSK